MSEIIERVALALAKKIHLDALAFNLREIGQEDKIQDWLGLYPIKVTDQERALARVALKATSDALGESSNSSLLYTAEELEYELRESA